MLIRICSVVEPVPPFLAGAEAVKKGRIQLSSSISSSDPMFKEQKQKFYQ